MMIATMIYSWHFAGGLLVATIAMAVTSKLARRHVPIELDDRGGVQYQKIALNNLSDTESRPPHGAKSSKLKETFVLDSSEEEV